MGLLKTQKLDNGMIGFECIYGGLEAPFGGIDASKNPRYIDPKCFADASNFLIIDNELCIATLEEASIPTPASVTYPLLTTASTPGVLLGVGKLPCENVVKNWALYVSPSADSNNYYYYELILWTTDTNVTEVYDFPLLSRQKLGAQTNATARLKISYTGTLTTLQTVTPEPPTFSNATGYPALTQPISYNNTYYETSECDLSITGAPSAYAGVLPFTTRDYGAWDLAGGRNVPTLAQFAQTLVSMINATGAEYPYPFTASIDPTDVEGATIILTASTTSGKPSVDGALGNAITLSGTNFSTTYMRYYPSTTGYSSEDVTKGPVSWESPLAITPWVDPSKWPFTNPSVIMTVLNQFSGGVNAGAVLYQDLPIQQLTWETVGDNLFLAGWPAGYMLQFSNSTKQLTYLTQYQGARVLKKLAGHLISVGMINSWDQTETNTQLWFNWSQAGVYSQWAALDSNSLVTGAGGEQLADISDILTGLVVSNSIAFILRAEGLSYVTVLQSASVPFDIAHVALCKDGQGCPSTSLWTQFDQLGFYVGKTNVFMLGQSPQAIGDYIVPILIPRLLTMTNRLTDPPPPYTIQGNPPPFSDPYYQKVNVDNMLFQMNNKSNMFFGINLEEIVYVYDPQYGTWMKLNLQPEFWEEELTNRWSILKFMSLPGNNVNGELGSYQHNMLYFYGQYNYSGTLNAPIIKILQPNLPSDQVCYVKFPAEEISFGRDVVIDALYVLASGVPGAIVNFTIDGWQSPVAGQPAVFVTSAFQGTMTLSQSSTPQSYEEHQVFNSDGSAVMLKSPQLNMTVNGQFTPYVQIVPYPVNSTPELKIVKIAMYGSFDPNQRPV